MSNQTTNNRQGNPAGYNGNVDLPIRTQSMDNAPVRLQSVQGGMVDYTAYDIMPVYSLEQAMNRRQRMIEFVKSAIMVDGVDYGTIPGTEKPTLLKPGAEKLASFFGLSLKLEVIEKVEDWDGSAHGGEPLFYYWYRCQAWRGLTLIAEADGSSNSRENKYRWRWAPESELPDHVDKSKLVRRGGAIVEPDFAVEKAETSGRYGKPAEYWEAFRQAISDGTARRVKKAKKGGGEMDAWEIGSWVYRIPNEDISSQINTIQKMAQKRAIVAATLIAVNASEFFTQDIEDLTDMTPAPVRLPETKGELGEEIKSILLSVNEAQRTRIEAVRDAIFGSRRRDIGSWSLDETRTLRDAAREISTQEYEPVAAPMMEQSKPKSRSKKPAPAQTDLEMIDDHQDNDPIENIDPREAHGLGVKMAA